MIDYSNEIRKRVRAMAEEKTVPPTVNKSEPSILTVFLGAMLVLMSLVIIFVAFRGHQSSATPQQPAQPPRISQPFVQPKNDVVGARLAQQDQTIKNIAQRVWLLGLAHNENANIAKKFNPNERFITLDEEWRLNKVPETMSLTPDQREDLKNWVKKD
jgi:hypothetical protein